MLKSISLAIELRNKAKDRYIMAFAEFERQQNIYKRVLLSEKSLDGMPIVHISKQWILYRSLFSRNGFEGV